MSATDPQQNQPEEDSAGDHWSRRQPSLPLVAILLTAAVLGRSIISVWTIQQGFIEYNADGFSRIIRGWEWLQAPRWEVEVWLPLHFWFYGGILAVWENVFLAPRSVNFLLGIATILLIYGIGSRLADRRTGLIAAGFAALFPYEVWLSLSGMSEPLFHFLIAFSLFGLIAWWSGSSQWFLIAGGATLAAATAVRYEAWFFAAVFAPLILVIPLLRTRKMLLYAIPAAAVACSFMLLWVQQNWQVHGDALAFARRTEQAKIAEDQANIGTSLLERLSYFPEIAFTTAPGVILLGTVSSIALLILLRERWWPLLAFVWGQAALMIAVTSAFASQGPGAERYLLINTLLLLLPIAGMISLLISRYRVTGIAVGVGISALLLISFVPDWIDPPTDYPDDDTRDLALFLQDAERPVSNRSGDEADDVATVLLPEIPDERFNEGYAIRVLSGYPGEVEITDEPSRLYESVQRGEAHFWVMESQLEQDMPPATEHWEIGGYVTGSVPAPAFAGTDQETVEGGSELVIDGGDFLPDEALSSWWTAPNGDVYAAPDFQANQDGQFQDVSIPVPQEPSPGIWTVTVAGDESQRQAFVDVEVVP